MHLLEKSFEAENKLEPEKKTQLAKKLGMQPRQVAVWFQNRRARWKTKQLERDYDVLKSSYDSLLSNYDSIKKENEKLKSEVRLVQRNYTPLTWLNPHYQTPAAISDFYSFFFPNRENKSKANDSWICLFKIMYISCRC